MPGTGHKYMKQKYRHTHQKGFALVVSLLFLVVLTLLGVSMFSNVGLQQRMAGNTREKNRAFQAAQTALRYGEWWLSQSGNANQGTSCSGTTNKPRVCSNILQNPTSVPWGVGTTYSAPANGQLTVSKSGGVNTYYSAPRYYIQYLGFDGYTGGNLYRVTAWASGGNANAIAVVESVFLVGAGGGNSTPAISLSAS